MRIRYFQDGNGFIAVTDETPKGPLKGMVYVGRGPTVPSRINTIEEQAYATDQVLKLPSVSAADVPDEWMLALGYEEPKLPEPVEPHTVQLEIELPGDRLRRMIRAPRGTPDYYRVRRKWKLNAVLLAISAAIAWRLVFAVWNG